MRWFNRRVREEREAELDRIKESVKERLAELHR